MCSPQSTTSGLSTPSASQPAPRIAANDGVTVTDSTSLNNRRDDAYGPLFTSDSASGCDANDVSNLWDRQDFTSLLIRPGNPIIADLENQGSEHNIAYAASPLSPSPLPFPSSPSHEHSFSLPDGNFATSGTCRPRHGPSCVSSLQSDAPVRSTPLPFAASQTPSSLAKNNAGPTEKRDQLVTPKSNNTRTPWGIAYPSFFAQHIADQVVSPGHVDSSFVSIASDFAPCDYSSLAQAVSDLSVVFDNSHRMESDLLSGVGSSITSSSTASLSPIYDYSSLGYVMPSVSFLDSGLAVDNNLLPASPVSCPNPYYFSSGQLFNSLLSAVSPISSSSGQFPVSLGSTPDSSPISASSLDNSFTVENRFFYNLSPSPSISLTPDFFTF